MLNWLFKKRPDQVEVPPSFQFEDSLTLDWNEDCEGWTTALEALGHAAHVYIGPRAGVENPQAESCALVVQARENIVGLNDIALGYLVKESSAFVQNTYKHHLSLTSFNPMGIEIFEHEGTPGEYSLAYDPVFDEGAVWRVRFKQHLPTGWSFDD